MQKKPQHLLRLFRFVHGEKGLALACFEPALRLVDHIDTALTAHDAAVAVPALERAERVLDLHGLLLIRGAQLERR